MWALMVPWGSCVILIVLVSVGGFSFLVNPVSHETDNGCISYWWYFAKNEVRFLVMAIILNSDIYLKIKEWIR